jgi:hypothetical protein
MPGEEQRRSPLSYVEVTEQKRQNNARQEGIPWKRSRKHIKRNLKLFAA